MFQTNWRGKACSSLAENSTGDAVVFGELRIVQLCVSDAEGQGRLHKTVFAEVNAGASDLRAAEEDDVSGAKLIARNGVARSRKFLKPRREMNARHILIHAANQAEGVHSFARVAADLVRSADPFGRFAQPHRLANDHRVGGVRHSGGWIGRMIAGVF